MKIINKTKNQELSDKSKIAGTYFAKLKGLLGRKSLEKGEALIILNAHQIHSFFMKFTIDLIFLDKNKKIIKIYNNFKPFRITNIVFKSKYVIELPSGILNSTNSTLGDLLEF